MFVLFEKQLQNQYSRPSYFPAGCVYVVLGIISRLECSESYEYGSVHCSATQLFCKELVRSLHASDKCISYSIDPGQCCRQMGNRTNWCWLRKCELVYNGRNGQDVLDDAE